MGIARRIETSVFWVCLEEDEEEGVGVFEDCEHWTLKENFMGLEGRCGECNLRGVLGVKWEAEDDKLVED